MQKKDFKYLFVFTISLVITFFVPQFSKAGVIPQPPNNLGLVGYWSFEGVQDTSVDDYSGNGNTGTMTNMDAGTDYVSGYKSGSTALDFDGTNDYVSILNEAGFDFDRTDLFTLSVWLKQPSGVMGASLAKMANSHPYVGWSLGVNSNSVGVNDAGKIVFQLINTWTSNTISVATTNDTYLNDGSWHHYVVTYDGSSSASGVKIYEDGVSLPVTVGYDSLSSSILNDTAVTIGSRASGLFPHQGGIDDVRIYSRALSASEVSLLYNRSATTYSHDKTNLIGYWSFEDATGTIATDFSGNGNHGTLTNMSNDDWVQGRVGKALDFDGSDDQVVLADTNIENSDFTISAWSYYKGSGNATIYGQSDTTVDSSFIVLHQHYFIMRDNTARGSGANTIEEKGTVYTYE